MILVESLKVSWISIWKVSLKAHFILVFQLNFAKMKLQIWFNFLNEKSMTMTTVGKKLKIIS